MYSNKHELLHATLMQACSSRADVATCLHDLHAARVAIHARITHCKSSVCSDRAMLIYVAGHFLS